MGDKCRAAPLPASCVLSLVLAVVLVPTPARGQAGAAGSTTSSTKKTPAVRPWAPSLTDPADGRIPPLTPGAQQRQAAARAANQRPPAGPEDMPNSYRCITTGVPKLGGLYGAGHFSYYQIFQTRNYVAITTETIHEARIIPLDGRAHLPGSMRQWNGDSRGRWEGNTLVIDTTNFSPKSNFMGSSDNLHLIERFTRVAPDQILYELTISDPTTWTRSWTAMMPMR